MFIMCYELFKLWYFILVQVLPSTYVNIVMCTVHKRAHIMSHVLVSRLRVCACMQTYSACKGYHLHMTHMCHYNGCVCVYNICMCIQFLKHDTSIINVHLPFEHHLTTVKQYARSYDFIFDARPAIYALVKRSLFIQHQINREQLSCPSTLKAEINSFERIAIWVLQQPITRYASR